MLLGPVTVRRWQGMEASGLGSASTSPGLGEGASRCAGSRAGLQGECPGWRVRGFAGPGFVSPLPVWPKLTFYSRQVMVPGAPLARLVVGHPTRALGLPQRPFDPKPRGRPLRQTGWWGVRGQVGGGVRDRLWRPALSALP
jgi:hypothetical protein